MDGLNEKKGSLLVGKIGLVYVPRFLRRNVNTLVCYVPK